GRAHGVRADLRPAARGHLVRQHPAAPVRDLPPIQHGAAAAAHSPAEDAAQRRRARPRALSAARHLAHRDADPAGVDARAHGRAPGYQEPARADAGAARGRPCPPTVIKGALHRAQGGIVRMLVETPEVEALRAEIRRANRRRDAFTVGAVVLLAGLVWLALDRTLWPGWVLTALGAGGLLAAHRFL